MPDYNLAVLIGRLTRNPELKYLPSGVAVANFSIAINSSWGSGAEKKEKTTFIDITAWKRTAELAAEYLTKGSSVMITGSIDQETWEKDGQKRSKLKVTAQRIQFLDRKAPLVMADSPEQSASPESPAPGSEDQVPF